MTSVADFTRAEMTRAERRDRSQDGTGAKPANGMRLGSSSVGRDMAVEVFEVRGN